MLIMREFYHFQFQLRDSRNFQVLPDMRTELFVIFYRRTVLLWEHIDAH